MVKMDGEDGWRRWMEEMDGEDGWRRWMEEMDGGRREMDEGADGLRRERCLIQRVDNK